MARRRDDRRRGTLLVVSAVSLLLLLAGPAMAAPPTVDTGYGKLRGQISGGVSRFMGIPYAAPPVGNLRWNSPRPPASWSGVRDALDPGSRCPQLAGALINPKGSTDEDCLFLNVYAPARIEDDLPVVVWIHGGGFVIGAGSDYDPSELVRRGDVIVVTINYRLGALGYLALPGLAAENRHGSTGNYGLQDQQQALRWVNANIGNFGGDAGNVTIAGESAGGFSVCDHLAAPHSQGLFEKAIVQSGPCSSALAAVEGVDIRTRSQRFAARPELGCTGTPAAVVACMRAQPAEQLLTALAPLQTSDPSLVSNFVFLPSVDGHYLPTTPRRAILTGRTGRVPILHGTTHDEGALIPLANSDIPGRPLNADTYSSELARLLSDLLPVGSQLSAEVMTKVLYPLRNYPTPPGYDSYVAPAHLGTAAAWTDAVFSCSALNTHGFTTVAGHPVYAYEFNDPTAPSVFPSPHFPLRAYHASELQYLFDSSPFGGGGGLSGAKRTLSNRMLDYWANFAWTGDPNGRGLPTWPQYTVAGPRLMNLAPGDDLGAMRGGDYARDHKCAVFSPLDILFTPLLTILDVLPKPAVPPSAEPGSSPAAETPVEAPATEDPATAPAAGTPATSGGGTPTPTTPTPAGSTPASAPRPSCTTLLQRLLKLLGLRACRT